ncbi:MAG: hypothetical protein KKG92_15485, partial [Gammaproteobacteria bacterium]|nr:hypothetical protein [Gammaproteobacteria bacterium]
VRKDEQMYMQIARDGVGSGLLTPNEARTQYLDQPEAEGNPAMDEYYLPINMIPISESSFETTTDNTTVSKSAPEKKKINAAVVKQIYRASVNTRRKIGKSIKKDMKSFFTAQEGRVMAALDSEKSLVFDRKLSVGDIFDADAERKLLQKELKKGHIGVILRAIQDTNGALGTEVDPSTSNPQVTARVGKMANRSRLITNTTMEKIQNTIKDGLDAGDSIGDLKKRVESVFDIARGYRAEMIARTESAKAYDMGSILSYDEAGIEFVDVIGCEDNETDCNSRHVPIGEADQLEFHPNHTGVIVPSA